MADTNKVGVSHIIIKIIKHRHKVDTVHMPFPIPLLVTIANYIAADFQVARYLTPARAFPGLQKTFQIQEEKAMKMQKLGGYSVIAYMCLFVVTMVIEVLLLSRYGLNTQGALLDPAKMSALFSGSPLAARALGGLKVLLPILSLVFALALRERMQLKAPNLVRLLDIASSAYCVLDITRIVILGRAMAAMAGVADVSIYRPYLFMFDGINAAAGYVYGWVALLIGVAAIATRAFPRFIGHASLVFGIWSGIRDFLPNATGTAARVLSIIFALFYTVAIIWMCVEMLRVRETAPAKTIAAQAG
jgi:hypothetical protein